MLGVEVAVAKVMKVLRLGKEAQLAEIKRLAAAEKPFFVSKHNCLIPALALKLALLQYEQEEKELQTSTKPATLPAAPAASSSAEEEGAAPPPRQTAAYGCAGKR